MKIKTQNVHKDYVSCNFCSRGELTWGFSNLKYPYETVIEFGRSVGGGIVACICGDCIKELYEKSQSLLISDTKDKRSVARDDK